MGIIKAAINSTQGVLADQWKEIFYCDAIPYGIIGVRGKKRVSENSANTESDDNVITDGSLIIVSQGQIALAVEQGKAFACWSEPGEYEFHSSASSTVFNGGWKGMFQQIGKRISFGGDVPLTQRIYYFTTLESGSLSFQTPSSLPFRIKDEVHGINAEMLIRCTGSFTYRLKDPLQFYNRICGNFSQSYSSKRLESQLKSEFLTTVSAAIGNLSDEGMMLSQLQQSIPELCSRIRSMWSEERGLELVSLALNLSYDPSGLESIQNIQLFRDPSAMAAHLGASTAEAMKLAAANRSSANRVILSQPQGSEMDLQAQLQRRNNSWKCICGTVNTGNFCIQCGRKRPG